MSAMIANISFQRDLKMKSTNQLSLDWTKKSYQIVLNWGVFKDENDEDAEGTEEKEMDCPICYETTKCVDLIKLNCSHQFCGLCLKSILERHNINILPTCALCRTFMTSFDIQNLEVYHLVAKHCIDI